MLRDRITEILKTQRITVVVNHTKGRSETTIEGNAVDQLESLFNSNLKEQREGIVREMIDSLDEVYFTANNANSDLSEMDRVEIKANNNAVRRCIEILATNTLEVKV